MSAWVFKRLRRGGGRHERHITPARRGCILSGTTRVQCPGCVLFGCGCVIESMHQNAYELRCSKLRALYTRLLQSRHPPRSRVTRSVTRRLMQPTRAAAGIMVMMVAALLLSTLHIAGRSPLAAHHATTGGGESVPCAGSVLRHYRLSARRVITPRLTRSLCTSFHRMRPPALQYEYQRYSAQVA